MDAKPEFYRYPSLALLFIRHFCISCSTSTWDFPRQLNECEALDVTSEERTNFHLYLCLFIFIRMAAYLFLDSQNDKVSALPSSTTAKTKDDKQWHIPAKLYFISYISFEMVSRGPFGFYDSEFGVNTQYNM